MSFGLQVMDSQISSGIHCLRATWCPRESTSHVLSPSSFIHGGSPSTIRSHDWTQSFSNTQASNTHANGNFDTLALNASLLSMHETFRSPELSNSRKYATWFRPSGLLAPSIKLHPKSSGISKSQTLGVSVTSPTTLARRAHTRG
jgi:hypothetical protein